MAKNKNKPSASAGVFYLRVPSTINFYDPNKGDPSIPWMKPVNPPKAGDEKDDGKKKEDEPMEPITFSWKDFITKLCSYGEVFGVSIKELSAAISRAVGEKREATTSFARGSR